MDTPTTGQLIMILLSGGLVFYFQFLFKRNAKHLDDKISENAINTQRKFDELADNINKVVISVQDVTSLVHTIKDDLIEKVSNNRLENKELDTKIEKLETRVDNLEKIIDRRAG